MHRRIRRVFTALKEQTHVSYAKIATAGGFCDIDLIIIKATAPNDLLLPERYVRELLKIFTVSPISFRSFCLGFSRRFGKTRCWRVALKCLLLLHRLLNSAPDSNLFRTELIWARANALLSLYPCHFCDTSSTYSNDYTMFIKSYATFLNESLNCFSIDTIIVSYLKEENEERDSFSDKMKEVSRLIKILPRLQMLIDRVIQCKPIGQASKSFIIKSAMTAILRNSFTCYTLFRSEIIVVLDNLFQMPYQNCISAFGIYKRAAIQASRLSEFYEWCKSTGLCGDYEYPFVETIPHIHIRALETFITGMWKLTDTSQSDSSSMIASPSSCTDDYECNRLGDMRVVVSTVWEKFEDDDEREPLIQLETVNENVSWETLLEHSIGKRDEWQMQVYHNPYVNPYNYQPNEFSGSNPQYPWGL